MTSSSYAKKSGRTQQVCYVHIKAVTIKQVKRIMVLTIIIIGEDKTRPTTTVQRNKRRTMLMSGNAHFAQCQQLIHRNSQTNVHADK